MSDLSIFSNNLPAKSWKWRSAAINGGGARLPSEMRTSHLFYTLRMIWNHVMPENMAVGGNVKRYRFSADYTPDYMAEAIRRLGSELSTRSDLEVWQYEQLAEMARHLRANEGSIEAPKVPA